MTAGMPNCPAALRNTSSAEEPIAGAIRGSVTRVSVRQAPAPWMRAASSSAGSIERSAPATNRNTIGE